MTLELFLTTMLTPIIGIVILFELYRVSYINKKELEVKNHALEIRVKLLEMNVQKLKREVSPGEH